MERQFLSSAQLTACLSVDSPDAAGLACPSLVPVAFFLLSYLALSTRVGKPRPNTYLVQGLAAVHQNPHRLSVLQTLFQLLQLQSSRTEVLILSEERKQSALAQEFTWKLYPTPTRPGPLTQTHRGLRR